MRGVLDLLSGDAGAFVDQVWGERVAVHKADADDLVHLLSLDDVDALVTSTGLRTPALRVAQDGSVLPASSYTRSGTIAGQPLTGLVDPRRLVGLFESGATLVLQGLHRYWPPLTGLVRDLERALGHPCQANAYLTPPGAQGFAVHSDTHDVFVVQTYGAKQWEVHDRGTPLDVLMEVGTSMYLPAGTPHAARTQQTASLHVTVGINQLSYRGVLRSLLDEVLDEAEYGERLPAAYLDDPRDLVDGLAARLRRVADDVANLQPDALADRQIVRFLSSRGPALRGVLSDALCVAALDDDTMVARRRGAHCLVQPAADGADRIALLLGDRRLAVPGWVRPAARHVAALAAEEQLRPRDLAPWLDEQSRLVFVRRLVREGMLKVVG